MLLLHHKLIFLIIISLPIEQLHSAIYLSPAMMRGLSLRIARFLSKWAAKPVTPYAVASGAISLLFGTLFGLSLEEFFTNQNPELDVNEN